jgi:hypothetical protein
MSDLNTTTEYYKDLLLYQYLNQPKARATIGELVKLALTDFVAFSVRNAFDIETAVGVQLDQLGEYIGLSRRVFIDVSRPYFQFVDYAAPVTCIGMTDYTDPSTNLDSVFYRYIFAQNSFYDLTDDEYRFMLKFKIVLNSCDATAYSISTLLYNFFGTDISFFDGEDMTISYAIPETVSYFVTLAIDLGLLPKPMGVRLVGVFQVTDPAKLFGFADYTYDIGNIGFSDYISGFNGYQFLDYTNKL